MVGIPTDSFATVLALIFTFQDSFGVEQALNQELMWIGELASMPPGQLLLELYYAHTDGWRLI